MSEQKQFDNPKDLFLFNLNQNMEQIYQTLISSGGLCEGANMMCAYIQRLVYTRWTSF